jgi:hypothetical protein
MDEYLKTEAPAPTAKPLPPAGWYPHPSMVATQRYWDGASWTDHIAPASAPIQPHASAAAYRSQPEPDHDGLIVGGWVTAAVLPIVGFIIGIVLCAKGKGGHGVGAMVLSILAFFFWAAMLTPDPQPVYSYP